MLMFSTATFTDPSESGLGERERCSAGPATYLLQARYTCALDPFHPLCEQCGYDLAGLEVTEDCPECGRGVRESLAESRPGSPWQQHRSFTSWWRTNWATCTAPRALFAAVRIEPRIARGLLAMNTLLAGVILIAPWTGTLLGDPARTVRLSGVSSPVRELLTFTLMFPLQACAVMGVLALLTYLEYLGIRFIARRRAWRLTDAGAWQVCCHASVGWIILSIMPLLALAISYILNIVAAGLLSKVIDLSQFQMGRVSLGTLIAGALPTAGLLIGLFAFEYLVHLGVRSCRYAATFRPSQT